MEEELRQRLFDAWLEAAATGQTEDAAAFCARHGVEDAELESWLREVVRAKGSVGGEPLLAATRLGDFRLLRPLGEGGMGVVWLAEQESLERLAAVKVLRSQLLISPSAKERFRREATNLAQLKHPGIVQIHGFGIDGGVSWLAMEYVPGPSLASLLAESRETAAPIPIARLIGWFRQIGEALAAAHDAHLIHRDIKPANVIITPQGEARLLDFGIACELDATGTATKGFLGSPPYASPEQWSGGTENLDVRTDVWSFGASLYEAVSGRLPFEESPGESLGDAIRRGDPAPLRSRRAETPRDVETVVHACLEPDPERRYSTMAAVVADLRCIEASDSIARTPKSLVRRSILRARRHPRLVASVLGLLVVVAGVTMWDSWRTAQESKAARQRARDCIADVQILLGECETARQLSRSLEAERQRLVDASTTRHLDEIEAERLPSVVADLAETRLHRSLTTEEMRSTLTLAERLGPETAGLREGWLGWYFEKWATAAETGDRETAIHFRDRTIREDPGGPFEHRLLGMGTFSLTTEPSGATVHLFQVHDLHDLDAAKSSREVLVGAGYRMTEIPPGTDVLRVVSSEGSTLLEGDVIFEVLGSPIEGCIFALENRGALQRGDRVLKLDGVSVRSLDDLEDTKRPPASGPTSAIKVDVLREGKNARLAAYWSDVATMRFGDARRLVGGGGVLVRAQHAGAIITLAAQGILEVRASRAAPVLDPSNRIGPTPITDHQVLPGNYVAVVEKEGYLHRRILFRVPHKGLFPGSKGMIRHTVLLPEAARQPQAAYISCDEPGCKEKPFWILETEVTKAEFRRFLDTAPPAFTPPSEGEWSRNPAGRWSHSGRDSEPVLGVTAAAASAYAEWRNGESHTRLDGWEYALPSHAQWNRACGYVPRFVFGGQFVPHGVKSRYARATPGPEPVMSYPLDESRYGVYDLTGGAAEWLRATREGPHGFEQAVAGGSWRDADPEAFRAAALRWVHPDTTDPSFGFRLVLQPKESP